MCFSVNVNLVKEELETRYGATLIDHDKYRPSYYYHAFAFPEMPVVCFNPKRLEVFKWGLIPSGTRDFEEAQKIRSKTLNARSETLDKRKVFSGSFRSKRCLVPVKGFFEWQHKGSEKIPWYIYHSENQIISLAGLYDRWVFDKTGEVFHTFTIITTEANRLLAEIHNSTKRMPAILEPAEEMAWLDPEIPADKALLLLKPCGESILKAHTISPLINKREAERNTPEVIKPYQYQAQGNLF